MSPFNSNVACLCQNIGINNNKHVCMYVSMHACMYVCMYVCIYVCMHVCTYVCLTEIVREYMRVVCVLSCVHVGFVLSIVSTSAAAACEQLGYHHTKTRTQAWFGIHQRQHPVLGYTDLQKEHLIQIAICASVYKTKQKYPWTFFITKTIIKWCMCDFLFVWTAK